MDRQTYFTFNPWWEGKRVETGNPREIYLTEILKRWKRRQIEIIVGSRRVGKTTLIKQLIDAVIKTGVRADQVLYVSCDFAKAIGVPIAEHVKVFRQIFSHPLGKKLYLFFDEIQESPHWQIELKSIYDGENVKIVCSGSTSALISSHGGKLTGRQISTVIYPLTFQEFLAFRKIKASHSEAYILEKEAERYLQLGGYPENVLSPSDEYMSSLLDDIFARDLERIYPIKNSQLVKELYKIIASSLGSRVSFHRLANILEVSVDTVKDYISYFEGSFLTKKLEKWSSSRLERIYSVKKIYLWDTGFKTLLTGEGDMGAKAENAVYWALFRKYPEHGYFAEGNKEVDFVVRKGTSLLPVEVKYTDNFEKIRAGVGGMKLFFLRHPTASRGIVVTKNLDRKFDIGKGIFLDAVPLWRFLWE